MNEPIFKWCEELPSTDRATYIHVTYTFGQRLKMWLLQTSSAFSDFWCVAKEFPCKDGIEMVLLRPGDEGYDEAECNMVTMLSKEYSPLMQFLNDAKKQQGDTHEQDD